MNKIRHTETNIQAFRTLSIILKMHYKNPSSHSQPSSIVVSPKKMIWWVFREESWYEGRLARNQGKKFIFWEGWWSGGEFTVLGRLFLNIGNKRMCLRSLLIVFEAEYIKKNVQWHYGSSFPGQSRTNNSLESGGDGGKKISIEERTI